MTAPTSLNLSKRTTAILKNFASINPSAVLEVGSLIRTASPTSTILALASIDETIPFKFPIMDLNSFLGILSLPAFSECNLMMDAKKIDLIGKNTSLTFWGAAESLVDLPEGEIDLGEGDIICVIEDEQYHDFQKACGLLRHEFFEICNRSGKVYITALTPNLDTSNNYEVMLGETTKPDASLRFKSSNLQLLRGDYKVEASSEGNYAKFTTMDDRITYLIGAELD